MNRVLTYEQETEMRCRRTREEALEQGIEQGEDRFGALVAQLLEASRIYDVAEASSNPHRRNELFQEFGI